MRPAVLAAPYRCTACAAAWSYAEIRYTARCKHCGGGLTREAPDPPVPVAEQLARRARVQAPAPG